MTTQLDAETEVGFDRPSIEDLRARAEALVPVLRERAKRAEELRRVPDETIDDLEAAGLFYIASPRHLGGYGYGLEVVGAVTTILARGCTSTAWVYEFMVVYNIQLVQDMPELLEGRPFVRAAMSGGASLLPSGSAVPVEGGWRVSGTWPYASGITNADYAMLVTTEESDGTKEPAVIALVCQVSDAEILDDWHVAGMAATGSNSFRLDDVFIPVNRRWMWVFDEKPLPDGRAPFSILGLFGVLLAGCALGAAEAALGDFAARIQTRRLPMGAGHQRDSPVAWSRYGQAATEVRLARVLWEESARIVAANIAAGTKSDAEQAALLRMASPRVCQAAVAALQTIIAASGSSIFQLDNPLQRQWRDVQVITSHALMDPEAAYVSAGRSLLGLDNPSAPGAH